MKKYLITVAIAALTLSSCNKTEDPYVNVSNNAYEVECTGGTVTVDVKSNSSWTISRDGQDWYSPDIISGTGNSTLTITVDPYTEASARSASFTISAYGAFARVALLQKAPTPPSSVSENSLRAIAAADEYVVNVPAGYTFKAEADADWITCSESVNGTLTLKVDANKTDSNREATVTAKLTDGTVLSTVDVIQSWRNVEPGELLIEEVFFAGTLVPGSTSTYGDQYIKLTNNTDHVLYADGILFAISKYDSQASSTGAYWAPSELEDAIGVSTVYQIPGKGKDVPVEAGKSIVIAVDAQDYTADGGEGIDLSKADYEFNDVNDIYPDTDNPDVPDMNCWFKSSLTITILHNRGYGSYAIAYPPSSVTVESFVKDYVWNGTEDFWFRGSIFRTRDITGGYTIPNDWVIDGVNCAVEEYFRKLSFNDTIDAGYTGCGTIDLDPSRYGTSALRKTSGGKLVDTNNSTNDFNRNSVPTLSK